VTEPSVLWGGVWLYMSPITYRLLNQTTMAHNTPNNQDDAATPAHTLFLLLILGLLHLLLRAPQLLNLERPELSQSFRENARVSIVSHLAVESASNML
jgi:hypothetical protein